MEWVRYHPKTSAAVAAVVTVLVIVLVTVMSHSSTPAAPSEALSDTPTATPPVASLPAVTPTPKQKKSGQSQVDAVLKGLGGTGGAASGGNLQLNGLPGGSMYKNLPKHSIVLSVSSEAPIGTFGYLMPTSLRNSSGVLKNYQGRHWSLGSTVYGGPDYARIFVQAGPLGYPITCTITVDGRVTEHRSTDGPYGQLVCQG